MKCILLFLAAALAALPGAALAVDANTCGFVQGNGGWYKSADRSGPYSLDGNCNATLLGTGGGATGSVTPAGTPGTSAQAVQGIPNGVPQNVRLPVGATTTTDALQPPTAAGGKIVATSVSLSANTSTQLVAANDQRIAVEIQCDGTAIVGISRTGATLTSAAASPLVIPTGAYPLYTMPVATLTAITAYTGTAQTCRVTEYLR